MFSFKRALATLALASGIGPLALHGAATAEDGIVGEIVNSPLSAAGTVKDARVGINVYLQRASSPGMEFMDPRVPGFGIPAGGRMEIEMAKGFERDWSVPLSQSAIMLVTGAPQQGLPGKAVGYKVGEGNNERTFVITPTSDDGLPVDKLLSPAPGAKQDAVRQRGIKVLHIGFMESAFTNRETTGEIAVRISDGSGAVVHRGQSKVDFLSTAVPQILPTNLPHKARNHNWQTVKAGQTLGHTAGTAPVTLMLYAAANVSADKLFTFKQGILGAGVVSTQQLNAMGYKKPAALARYNGGLIVRDTDGNGRIEPAKDQIIGGIIGKAPKGAKGQELRSLETDGTPVLSAPAEKFSPKTGKRFGGAVMQLQFTAGDKPGVYRPTLALLKNPNDHKGGDGSRYTYTVVVE